MTSKYLPIYLNDHLVALTGAVELAKRIRGSNDGAPLGAYAAQLADELAAERAALRDVMRRAGAREDPLKKAVGVIGERVGRLKLNGELFRYSPLSRLVEVEGMQLLAASSEALWRSLEEAGLGGGEWAQRAAERREVLEEHRRAAAHEALAS